VPPVCLLAALALALFGAAPRWIGVAWGAWAVCLVLGMFGTLIDVPDAVRNLSPFEDVPSLPADSVRVLPVVIISAIAAALAAAGLTALRARDLA
jgi:ABC-2 type transport system permease protein